MTIYPLTLEEIAGAGGFTHQVVITHADLTEATANTAQTLTGPTLPAGTTIPQVARRLKTAFKDAADAAFNTTTMSIGTAAGGATAVGAAVETNENGTEVITSFVDTPVGPLAAETALTFVFSAMAGKNLAALTAGEIHILLQIIQPRIYAEAAST